MVGLEPVLRARLKQLKVRIDSPDADTLLLRNVPADSRDFSKRRTSVLVKRPRAGLPYLMCVDEDLEYRGPNRVLALAFAVAERQQGWRVVSAGSGVYPEAQDAVEQALVMLGVPAANLAVAAAKSGPSGIGLLARFGVNITAQVRNGNAPATVGREEAAEQAATAVLSWQRRLPVIVGASGLGKTNLLYKVARLLAEVQPERELLSVDLSCLLAGALWEGEREKLLMAGLEEAAANSTLVLVLERLELCVMVAPLTPWLLAGALDRGARLVGTCLPTFLEKLEQGPLARRLDPIEVTELDPQDTSAVLGHLSKRLVAHYGVAVDAPVIEAAVARSLSLDGKLPGKAITLLDAAAARAVLLRQPDVTLCDVYMTASRMRVKSD